jgi:hypothetical protein
MEQIWLDIGDFLWFTLRVFGSLLFIAFIFKSVQSAFENTKTTHTPEENGDKKWMN